MFVFRCDDFYSVALTRQYSIRPTSTSVRGGLRSRVPPPNRRLEDQGFAISNTKINNNRGGKIRPRASCYCARRSQWTGIVQLPPTFVMASKWIGLCEKSCDSQEFDIHSWGLCVAAVPSSSPKHTYYTLCCISDTGRQMSFTSLGRWRDCYIRNQYIETRLSTWSRSAANIQ